MIEHISQYDFEANEENKEIDNFMATEKYKILRQAYENPFEKLFERGTSPERD